MTQNSYSLKHVHVLYSVHTCAYDSIWFTFEVFHMLQLASNYSRLVRMRGKHFFLLYKFITIVTSFNGYKLNLDEKNDVYSLHKLSHSYVLIYPYLYVRNFIFFYTSRVHRSWNLFFFGNYCTGFHWTVRRVYDFCYCKVANVEIIWEFRLNSIFRVETEISSINST